MGTGDSKDRGSSASPMTPVLTVSASPLASSAGGSNPIARIVDGKLTNFSFATVKDQYLVSVAASNLVEVYKPYWEQKGYPVFPEAEKAQSTMKWSDIGITGQD